MYNERETADVDSIENPTIQRYYNYKIKSQLNLLLLLYTQWKKNDVTLVNVTPGQINIHQRLNQLPRFFDTLILWLEHKYTKQYTMHLWVK